VLRAVSADRAGTDVLLQNRFKTIYANSTVTVTQDYSFNLFAYAAQHPDKVLIREIPDLDSLKRVFFVPTARRRDGEGFLAETATFVGLQVAVGEEELLVYLAEVSGINDGGLGR